jgi:broad specificity phosphatase PhoE
MSALPVVYLARHGGTAWTVTGQHTGVTDLPLTAEGEGEAIRLGERFATLLWNENPHHEHISLARAQWRREKAQR